MKYFLPVIVIMTLGAGCISAPVTNPPIGTTKNILETNPVPPVTTTTTVIETAPEVKNKEIAVQNFGNVTYVPSVVKVSTMPESKYEMEWQGWWKIGYDKPGRPVYVLIEGSDEYFYATNADRSVEARGHWKVSADGALTVETPERILTTFKRGILVDENIAYVLRGNTWEKWESVVDPMLP